MAKALILGIWLLLLAPLAASAADCVVESYFVEPESYGTIMVPIYALIEQATSEITVAVHSFEDTNLAEALIDAHNRGVKVDVLMDYAQASSEASVAYMLDEAGIAIYVDTEDTVVDYRFMVVDQEITVTGSYDWCAMRQCTRFDSIVVVRCREVAESHILEISMQSVLGKFRRVE